MEVLIAGAGPAGSRLAERLASRGLSVTLVERLKEPGKNSFSSAVIPIEAIQSGLIPKQPISAYWKCWQIFDPNGKPHQWTNSSNLGVVLDFGKLREQLWSEAIYKGVELMNGWSVKSVVSLLEKRGCKERRQPQRKR